MTDRTRLEDQEAELLIGLFKRYDHIETIHKSRVLQSKGSKRIYNYTEYLVHSEPGSYDAVLIFEKQDTRELIALKTKINVYLRGTARYMTLSIDPVYKLRLIALKKQVS